MSITKRVSACDDGKPSYRVRIYHKGRYIASRTFARKKDAVAWETEQRRRLAMGSFADPKLGDLPLDEWASQWLDSLYGRAQNTVVRYHSLVRIHILPTLGRFPITAIRPRMIQDLIRAVGEKHSPSTARQTLVCIRQIFKYAEAEGAIQTLPTKNVKHPRCRPNKPMPLTHKQLWELADSTGTKRDFLLILVAGYTGLRWGEITALQAGDYVPAERRLHITKAVATVRGRHVLSDVKDHADRSVTLPKSVAGFMDEWLIGKDPEDTIFAGENGQYLDNSNFRSRCLDKGSKALGRAVTPHHLRDTAASLAIASGATVLAVARMLGHEDASVTMKHYAALFPNDLDDLSDRMDAAGAHAREHHAKGWRSAA